MKKSIVLLSICYLFFSDLYSQNRVFEKTTELEKKNSDIIKSVLSSKSDTVVWRLKGMTGIDVSQAYFENWSGGGENSFATRLYFNAGTYYRKNRSAWDNDVSLEFGIIYTDENKTRKNVDKIDFSSKYGYGVNKKLFYTGLVDFKSQFYKGYKYPNKETYLSNFMAPGYLIVSAGMDYKPVRSLSFFVSPATGRFTFVLDDSLSRAGAFGVEKDKKVLSQIGFYTKFVYHTDIMTNINLKTKLELFTAYDKSLGNFDVNWEMLIGMKINKYIMATLSTTLKYDNNVKTKITSPDKKNKKEVAETRGAKIQFKELLGIGLAFKF